MCALWELDECLPDAVTYRRRDFEVDAMMRALVARSGLVVPSKPPSEVWPADRRALCVLVICDSTTGRGLLSQLSDALQDTGRSALTQEKPDLETADRVLLLLTKVLNL